MKRKLFLFLAICTLYFAAPAQIPKDPANQEAGSHAVTGQILDEAGTPLPGATITLKGTSASAISNAQGRFSILVPSSRSVLTVTFVGYVPQDLTVGDKDSLKISLQQSNKMDEVVVIGYGSMKKSSLTGAVTKISSSTLNTVPAGNVTEALQGKIAGVQVGATTEPGSTPSIRIRGSRSISAGNDLCML